MDGLKSDNEELKQMFKEIKDKKIIDDDMENRINELIEKKVIYHLKKVNSFIFNCKL